MRRQDAEQLAPAVALKTQTVARQSLANDEAANLQRKIRDAHQAAGLLVEMWNFEEPAFRLAAGVLAGDAVEPAFDASGQAEVCRVDREDE
jgi:hypothetical protein